MGDLTVTMTQLLATHRQKNAKHHLRTTAVEFVENATGYQLLVSTMSALNLPRTSLNFF